MKNKNQQEKKEMYEAPAIYTVEVKVERGFQTTDDDDDSDTMSEPKGKGSW